MDEYIIRVLQHYRHDLMNRLQIVQGYLSMGKANQAEEKLSEVVDFYKEERKLMDLNVPSFMLWILEFNTTFKNFRLTYNIHAEYKSMHISDSILVGQCQEIMELCMEELDPQVLYEVKLELNEIPSLSLVTVNLSIEGDTQIEQIISGNMKYRNVNKEIDIESTNNGLIFSFSVPCQ
ncbi:Spo0B domain-containing protein [Oceanobacillus rekensis]|uniref:Spo0B domain-containing protein n=1 Tax=Oceanobacillus rekensis TaxID=937927 RepID=UPI0015949DC4|nr:Spo0B domain-containing protein [Oceanobacillus rekensis]